MISSNVTVSPYPVYPLGVSMIASALAGAGHEVRQFDFLEQNSSLEALAQEIESFGPQLIGISVRNIDNVNLMNEQYYIGIVKDIVIRAKEVSEAKVILGGAGFSLIPDLILLETGADYGVVGEGEMLMVRFAENAARGIYPEERLIGPEIGLSGTEIVSARYDEKLMEYYLHSGNIASIQTKRGCTQKCVYCSYPVLEGSSIRTRDVRAVVNDIELLRDQYKAKYIFFIDSVFNDAEGAYLEVLEEMRRRNINIPWTGFFKPEGLNDEIVGLMKATGLIAVEIGSDAACDITLRGLGKRFSFKNVIECNDIFSSFGIATSHYFMFGGPGETQETVLEGIENIKALKKCVSFIFMGIRILPNTTLARIALKEKVLSPENGMLQPVYYLSPMVERKWLEETLTKAFSNSRHCIFPPDKVDNSLRMLHKLGYAGTLWDMLIPGAKAKKRERRVARQ
ncbi:MAG: lipid biosynthesis B12-binding/radical SAM protein [Nitrospira bacterium HGW-Nitrospira-1]|nr:MAG: lipid biosynthesis B12-binding/radical SAM protein [Nitrospira bacterium HGW-Nitrospira-1]